MSVPSAGVAVPSLTVATRVRRALDRPVVRFGVVAAIATLAVVRSEGIVGDARRARTSWGRTATVLVAVRDLEPGTTIAPDDVQATERPASMLADDAAGSAVGRVVTATVARGEVVLDRRLAGGGTGPAALLDDGSVAFAVPVDPSTPALRVGDRVDVFAPVDSTSRTAVGATRAARRAIVVSVSDRTVMIGVDESSAAAVARALLGATVVLALAE